MDSDERQVLVRHRLLAVPDHERVVHPVRVTPLPPLHPLKVLGSDRLVMRNRQDKLGAVLGRRGEGGRLERLGRAAVEHAEPADEVGLAGRPVRAQDGVDRVGEERDGLDVVRGGPARVEAVGGGVARAGQELGDAAAWG